MNSDILLQTAAIFFLISDFGLNQGIDLVYAMVDFICIGFLELQGAEAIITKRKKNSYTQRDSVWSFCWLGDFAIGLGPISSFRSLE